MENVKGWLSKCGFVLLWIDFVIMFMVLWWGCGSCIMCFIILIISFVKLKCYECVTIAQGLAACMNYQSVNRLGGYRAPIACS